MNSWADIRDWCENILENEGCYSSSDPVDMLDEIDDYLETVGMHAGQAALISYIRASLQADGAYLCDFERVARACEGLVRGRYHAIWQGYDPKAEGIRKYKERFK